MKIVALITLLLAAATTALAAPTRWQQEFAAFAAEDARGAPPPGGLLFVGSSSIRLWEGLEKQFDAKPGVIKRGFGGSRLSDCLEHLDRLVLRYRPARVVLYAGDNDLAEGATPAQVLRDFASLVERVRERLPQTRIAFVSIKPSPARQALLPAAREANALVRAYAEAHDGTDFIDVFTPMLGADGAPRPELFRSDALHLNDAGYGLWRTVLLRHLH